VIQEMAAPSQMPFMQGKREGIAGHPVQALIAGPKRRYAVDGGYGFDRNSGI